MLRNFSSKQNSPLLSCKTHPAEGFRSFLNCNRTLLHIHKSSPRNIRAKSCTIISMWKKSHVSRMCALGDWQPPLDLQMKTVGWVNPGPRKNLRLRFGSYFQLTCIGNKDYCLSSPLSLWWPSMKMGRHTADTSRQAALFLHIGVSGTESWW